MGVEASLQLDTLIRLSRFLLAMRLHSSDFLTISLMAVTVSQLLLTSTDLCSILYPRSIEMSATIVGLTEREVTEQRRTEWNSVLGLTTFLCNDGSLS